MLERIDDSPESIMMESVLEGMAEYYSKNLGREVMKGMKETALQCKHTGGCTSLGFTLNAEKRLEIEPHEAEAVRIIFQMFADGHGYTAIINYLNEHGYKTKRGQIFGKNSLYEILNNEKYTGVFVFNKRAEIEIKLSEIHQLSLIEYSDFSPIMDEFKELEKNTEKFRTFIKNM